MEKKVNNLLDLSRLLQIDFYEFYRFFFVVVQSLSRVWFCKPHGLIAACRDSLSLIISQSSLKLKSIESAMPSNHLTLCHSLSSCLQSFPSAGSFSMSRLFAYGGQSIGASASSSVLLVNIQHWFLLGLTGLLVSLQFKGLSRVFSSTTVQRHRFFGTQPFLLSGSHIHTRLME